MLKYSRSYLKFFLFLSALSASISAQAWPFAPFLMRTGVSSIRLLSAPPRDYTVDFLVGPFGTIFPVPAGAIGPTLVINSRGKVTGVAFVNNDASRVSIIRLMNPTPPRGRSPGYPNGYVKYENRRGQGVDPYTGRTVSNRESHHGIE